MARAYTLLALLMMSQSSINHRRLIYTTEYKIQYPVVLSNQVLNRCNQTDRLFLVGSK